MLNPMKSSAIARLWASHCDVDPTTLADAQRLIEDAQHVYLPTSASVLAQLMFSLSYKIPTTDLESLAVTAGSDGILLHGYNPEFVTKLAATSYGVPFGVTHEMLHLVRLDVFTYPELRSDPDMTTAKEVMVNYAVKSILKVKAMPLIDGKPYGIDPDEILKKVNAGRSAKGLPAIDLKTLCLNTLDCYEYVKQMEKPPSTSVSCTLVLGQGAPGSGSSSSSGSTSTDTSPEESAKASGGGASDSGDDEDDSGDDARGDQEATETVVDEIVERAVHAAVVNRNQKAADELKVLMDVTQGDDRLSALWGRHSAHRLLGVEVGTRTSNFWRSWVMGSIATRIDPGTRWIYPEKLGAVMMVLGSRDIPLRPRGHREIPAGRVYCDTSGSMSREFLNALAPHLRELDDVKIEFHDFDPVVEDVGQCLRDGAGTNFDCIEEHVRGLDESPDFVLVITDGHAPHITPSEPDKWIWLIVPTGDEWPAAAGMACRRLDPSDLE